MKLEERHLTSADNPASADESYTYDEIGTEQETNNLRFAGQYYDAESGLHYNFNRYYDPQTGRYTQADPIGFAGGDLNLYVYVENNPVNFVDPLGLWKIPGTNWCGPGGSGPLTGCSDKACKAHDKCYEKCGLDAKTRLKKGNILSKCAIDCDMKLAKRWKKCACNDAGGSW